MSTPSYSKDLGTEVARPDRPAWGGANVLRWLVRMGCLGVLTAMVWPGVQLWPTWFRLSLPGWIQRLESPEAARFVPGLSPWIALCSLAATHMLSLAAGLGIGVGLVAFLRRRWFCRWMCPMGVCAELAGRGGRLLRLRAFRCGRIGQWIALLTLPGALVGYPLLLWLDPLSLWTGWITWASSRGHLPSQIGPQEAVAQPTPGITEAASLHWFAAGVVVVLGISFLLPGLWCGRLCPLGGLQEVLWQIRQTAVRAVLRIFPKFRPQEAATPGEVHSTPSPPDRLGRRVVLAGLIGAGWAYVAKRLRTGQAPPLRPPGSAEEPVFTGLCIRCGNCLRVCPSRILVPDRWEHGWAGLLAPAVQFDKDYCREDCNRCTLACPSGALRPIALQEKPQARIGLARVDMGRCLLGEARECFLCRDRCPYQAIRTVFSPIEYTLVVEIDPAKCNGCGACQVSCPTWPRAIVVGPV